MLKTQCLEDENISPFGKGNLRKIDRSLWYRVFRKLKTPSLQAQRTEPEDSGRKHRFAKQSLTPKKKTPDTSTIYFFGGLGFHFTFWVCWVWIVDPIPDISRMLRARNPCKFQECM